MYYVYILRSGKDKGYYIGYTSDLTKRLRAHNAGKTRSLRHRLLLALIYWETYSKKGEAKLRELQIKSWKGGEAFKKLIGGSPRLWRD